MNVTAYVTNGQLDAGEMFSLVKPEYYANKALLQEELIAKHGEGPFKVKSISDDGRMGVVISFTDANGADAEITEGGLVAV